MGGVCGIKKLVNILTFRDLTPNDRTIALHRLYHVVLIVITDHRISAGANHWNANDGHCSSRIHHYGPSLKSMGKRQSDFDDDAACLLYWTDIGREFSTHDLGSERVIAAE